MRISKEELKTRPIRITLNVHPLGAGAVVIAWGKPMKVTEMTTNDGSFAELVRDHAPEVERIESVQVEIETGLARKSRTWRGGPLATLMSSELTVRHVLALVRAAAISD